ncbi:MAG: carbohydrate ABC transporter permease [Anaerolineae bacterium]
MLVEKGWRQWLFDVLNHVFLGALAIACVLPLVHLVAVSFSGRAAAEGYFVTLWPVDFGIRNYELAFRGQALQQSLIISIQRTVLGTAISLALTLLTAYPLSKTASRLKGRNIMMWLVLFAWLFPAGLIPWFLVIRSLGMLNTMWALVLPNGLPAWNVILMANFFRDVPTELEEAAIVDGASQWRIFASIYLPLSIPAVATMTLLSAVFHWNSWFDGMVLMTNRSRYPLMTYVREVVIQFEAMRQAADTQALEQIGTRGFKAALIVVATLPILCVYPFLQRYFVTGMRLGAIKG